MGVADTICWPNRVLLDPDVRRGEWPASSVGQRRLIREQAVLMTAECRSKVTVNR